MSVVYIGGLIYYVSFIDGHSMKTWIYFMKTKDEFFSRFQKFKALVENLNDRKIKVLRSNNGGKYTSSVFKKFYADFKIMRELTSYITHNKMESRRGRTS